MRIQHEPASPGIAIGKTHILSQAVPAFPKYWIRNKEIPGEILKLKRAIQKSKQQLSRIKEKLCRFRGKDQIQILDSHSMLLSDEMIITHTIQHITNSKINAEWALDKTILRLKMAFSDVRDEYFQQRKNDIDYIGQRIMKNLVGSAEFGIAEIKHSDVILVAPDLSPADVAALPRNRVVGLITSAGAPNSHSAIIAKSLEIPAIMGVENIMNLAKEDADIIIDAISGHIIINPTKKEFAKYREEQQSFKKQERIMLKEASLPTVTVDGVELKLVANIELAEEIPSALEHGAEGVGLYRTEFLFANRSDIPDEEEQFENYKTVLKEMAPRPVTIRTLDLGGEKLFIASEYADHVNPALGLKSIRLCLKEHEMFCTQLRALMRASHYGKLRIMLPMISGMNELTTSKKLLKEIKEEFEKSHIPFDTGVEVGIMIEVPSAVMIADELAREADFFSVGTNDLIQYTIAVDRTDEHVSYLYNPLHPAILRMLKKTIDSAKNAGIDVTICGEMAGDPLYLLILVGLGFDALSMNPISIPRVKKILRKINVKEARLFSKGLLKLSTPEEIEAAVKREMDKFIIA